VQPCGPRMLDFLNGRGIDFPADFSARRQLPVVVQPPDISARSSVTTSGTRADFVAAHRRADEANAPIGNELGACQQLTWIDSGKLESTPETSSAAHRSDDRCAKMQETLLTFYGVLWTQQCCRSKRLREGGRSYATNAAKLESDSSSATEHRTN